MIHLAQGELEIELDQIDSHPHLEEASNVGIEYPVVGSNVKWS
jgi:hypothetical protein